MRYAFTGFLLLSPFDFFFSSRRTHRGPAMHIEEYVPEIIPIITGKEKEIIEFTPNTMHTIVTVSIARTVVTEVLSERVSD